MSPLSDYPYNPTFGRESWWQRHGFLVVVFVLIVVVGCVIGYSAYVESQQPQRPACMCPTHPEMVTENKYNAMEGEWQYVPVTKQVHDHTASCDMAWELVRSREAGERE